MRTAVIFQYRLLHYRCAFFEQLREACRLRGIMLELVHGEATRREAPKRDEGVLPWARKVVNLVWEVGNRDLIWQPFPRELLHADLVVVMQENRILSNYPLLLSRLWSSRRVAYWGHGVNFQSESPAGLREKWKQLLLTRVDWWFAYTQLTADILARAGFPAERVSQIDNAIDNGAFERDLDQVSSADTEALRLEIDALGDSPIGLFCGSLYPDKRLDLMIEALDHVHLALPAFRMVVIGDGPSAHIIQSAALSRPWLKWVGVRKGREKAAWFKVADVMVNPGLVGLHVLDSFCSGVPMVTTAEARHSPEIAYLKDNVNGLIVDGGPDKYARALLDLLGDRVRLNRLAAAALESARRYSLEHMVQQFADGIANCIEAPPMG